MAELPSRPQVSPAEIFPYAAGLNPDKVALVVGTARLTYRELDDHSTAVAVALQGRGIGAGDVCSLYSQNSWEWIVAYHGILKAGAVVNPVNVMLTGPELAYVLADCGSKAIFAGAEQARVFATIAGEVPSLELFCRLTERDDDPLPEAVPFSTLIAAGAGRSWTPPGPERTALCSIGYTSGTTGHPKGAMQSHQSILLNCALTATMHGRTADDITVTALPRLRKRRDQQRFPRRRNCRSDGAIRRCPSLGAPRHRTSNHVRGCARDVLDDGVRPDLHLDRSVLAAQVHDRRADLRT
jgi:long-chain acyl-CoA synthetase